MTTEQKGAAFGTCLQQSCNIVGGGTCVEGHEDALKCSFFRPSQSSSTPRSNTAPAVKREALRAKVGIDLRGGPVHGLDAEAIMRTSLTKLVVVGGSPESGKTTLIASLYEQFQAGPFAGYLFRSSRTLVGFEHRCHLSRMSSERLFPETPRTVPEDTMRFLHLEIQKERTKAIPVSLLFADISGERFQAIQRRADEVTKVAAFSRADHFVLLMDSDKLLDPSKRHTEQAATAMLLRRLSDAGVLGKGNYVEVLFSKWDKVLMHAHRGECEAFTNVVREELGRSFGDRFGRLRFTEVAARPEKPDVGRQIGLDGLLQEWAETTPLGERSWHAPVEWPTDLSDFERQCAQEATN